MSLLVLEDLKKHFGDQEVLCGASLRVDPGMKVGLVGRNGGGKTTLVRMICGEESPDWGSVQLRKGARLGTVSQRPVFGEGVTVRNYVESGLSELKATLAEYETVGDDMGTADGEMLERLMRKHDRLSERVEELGGWETARMVETVLSGIGLSEIFWDRDANSLSGGEKSRVALARELVAGHDVLLLDEPTNHLDLVGIEWLEKYIRELKGAVIVVSHDRRLLDNVVDAIIELERGKLKRFEGGYTKYVRQKEERYDAEMRAWQLQSEEIKREELFIKKHMGSQRTAEAKGRLKRLSRVERLHKPSHDIRRPVISAPEAARGGEMVMRSEKLSGGYEDNVLFDNVALRIGRGQRIGIVGPNGAGKSTLLKILANVMEPLAGHVEWGHGAACSFYDQDTSALRDDFDVLGELRRHWPEMTDLQGRSHLARFLFKGGDVEKMVGTLSGGERARLCLSKIVLTKPSWFAFDEPTNHLDLASRTALEEMLGEFQGTIICISHDRAFLDGICDHIIEVAAGEVREYKGNYSSYRSAKDEESSSATEKRASAASAAKKAERVRVAAEEARAARSSKSGKKVKKGAQPKGLGAGKVRNPYMFKKLEDRIMKLELKLEKQQAAIATEEVYLNSELLKNTQIDIAEIEHELQVAYAEWENWG
ncbi:MAG: ATP-binding cassette subfamily F protein 3 [Planctomycetota bacterium]